MSKVFIIVFVFSFLQKGLAIKDTIKPKVNTKRKIIEIVPKYNIGGAEGFKKAIADNMIYPKSALKDKVSGKVVVQFYIDTFGKPVNFKIIQSVREDLDKEAIRLFKLLDDWTPGTQNGRKVPVKMTLPLNFTLRNKER